ncbi:ESCRT-I complex subunit VPS23, variant 2 [Entomophthora muscae]|uniref:ESCRT-I complex subunit VPS23, variant 2 n=1 Tax=Entomophthora muscae TaxID=34485 RepID=A0ACC2TRE3_9FUNG|nr:ESCRT-I complex subunit VPS23, variant 2 [Entomophthora muscae]
MWLLDCSSVRHRFLPAQLLRGFVGQSKLYTTTTCITSPILVWLPTDFPSIPPIAMVEPTPQMEIQVSNSINADGYFCHPYLQNWTSHARPSLLEVVHIMRYTFGKTPPLLTRASNPIRNEVIVDPPLQSHQSQGAKTAAQLASSSHLFQVSKPPNLSLTSLPPTSGSLLDSDKPIGDISQLQYKLYLKLRQASDQFNLKNSKTRNQIEYDNQLLNRNANKTRFCMSQLTQIKAQCHSNIDILQRAIAELNFTNEALSALSNAGISCIQFDKNPLTKQLVNLIAEDNSFEDTYYHLGRALSSQVIDLRTYLRVIFHLSMH